MIFCLTVRLCVSIWVQKGYVSTYYENSREKKWYLKDEKTSISKKVSKDLIKYLRAKSMSQVHLDKYINMTKYFFLRPKRVVVVVK